MNSGKLIALFAFLVHRLFLKQRTVTQVLFVFLRLPALFPY